MGGGGGERGDRQALHPARARARGTPTSSSDVTTWSSWATVCCAPSWGTTGVAIPHLDAADHHRRARPVAGRHRGRWSTEPAIALVTEMGTRTSHTSIMARALEIPAVVGVDGVLYHVRTGDMLIVDGLRGEVIVRPSEVALEDARARSARHLAFARGLLSTRDRLPCITACGVPVALRANVELPAEAILALDHGADGIGLYRTEFLYIDRARPARRGRAVRDLPCGRRGRGPEAGDAPHLRHRRRQVRQLLSSSRPR